MKQAVPAFLLGGRLKGSCFSSVVLGFLYPRLAAELTP
jgi:hypothetical protein